VFYIGGIGFYNTMSATMEGYDVFSQTLGNLWFWLAVPLISALSVMPTWLYFFVARRYSPSVSRHRIDMQHSHTFVHVWTSRLYCVSFVQ
jgi:hypothetical protein